IGNRLHDGIPDAFVRERRANLVVVGSLLEARGDHCSAFEIYAHVERLATSGLTNDRGSQTQKHEQDGNADKPAAVTHPVDIYIVKDLKHDDSLDTQRLHFLA